ncbi:hypothetical protein AB0D04_19905 [Streptomyces sp. NPDC048483]|uniref:hypothetical protein n=1 Tax=Streptomyces sp. NPDC048483 TaxID=3154927 RepID=UPI00344A254B
MALACGGAEAARLGCRVFSAVVWASWTAAEAQVGAGEVVEDGGFAVAVAVVPQCVEGL